MRGPKNIGGLDLSVKRIGYAAPSGALVSIVPHAGADDPARRLDELERGLHRAIRLHPSPPDFMVVENYSLASPGRLSLIRLGEIGGCARRTLFQLGIEYVEVPPTSLKLFATGSGKADKPKMIRYATEYGAPGSVNDDEADAFHLRRMGRIAHQIDPHNHGYELDAIANCGVIW